MTITCQTYKPQEEFSEYIHEMQREVSKDEAAL
jgi:hypothetical protein